MVKENYLSSFFAKMVFMTFQKFFFLEMFLAQKVDSCSCGGPSQVAVDGPYVICGWPYGSCGLSALFIAHSQLLKRIILKFNSSCIALLTMCIS